MPSTSILHQKQRDLTLTHRFYLSNAKIVDDMEHNYYGLYLRNFVAG